MNCTDIQFRLFIPQQIPLFSFANPELSLARGSRVIFRALANRVRWQALR